MVMHWRRERGPHWLRSALVNGLGAGVTGITVVVVLVAKFAQGAWITLLFIPLTIVFFTVVRRHYHSVKVLTTCTVPVNPASLSQPPIAVVPIDRWSNITRQGIEFAARLSTEVIALHVELGENSELLLDDWARYVEEPFRIAGREGRNSNYCLPLTVSSSFPSFSSFSIFRGRIPIVTSSWSFPSSWKTNGMNISFTISVAGCWNGCCWCKAMSASSR